MKTKKLLLASILALGTPLLASDIDATQLFQNKCAFCHITDLSRMDNKSAFIAPPADEIMTHAKLEYGKDKAKAIKSMSEYIMAPDPQKTFCASIETFGMMPAQKGIITQKEAEAIIDMMYTKYPRKEFTAKEAEKKGAGGMTFEKLDINKNGSITAKEFQIFRANRNNIDPNKFKNTLYFDRMDLNSDGKMDKKEFDKMKADKMRKKQQAL